MSGAEELRALGKALREAGDKELRKEVIRSLKETTKPLGDKAKDNAGAVLPAGVAAYIQATKVTTQVRLSGQNASVRIKGTRSKRGGKVDLDAIDRGRLRHPLFGNREHWYTQDVPAGWWTEAMEREAPDVVKELGKAVHDALKRAVRAGK